MSCSVTPTLYVLVIRDGHDIRLAFAFSSLQELKRVTGAAQLGKQCAGPELSERAVQLCGHEKGREGAENARESS